MGLAHSVLHRHTDPVQEHLVEMRVAGHLPKRANRYAGGTHVDNEHRDALALGPTGVGARQTGGIVAVLSTRRPDLLSVKYPRVAIAHGSRLHASEVRSGPWLAEEFAPDMIAAEEGWDEREFLLLVAVREDRRTAHAETDLEGAGRKLKGTGLAVENSLKTCGKPASAIAPGPGDAGEPGLGQACLKFLRPRHPIRGRICPGSLLGECRLEERQSFADESRLRPRRRSIPSIRTHRADQSRRLHGDGWSLTQRQQSAERHVLHDPGQALGLDAGMP